MYLNTKTVPRRSLLWFLRSAEVQSQNSAPQTPSSSEADAGNGKRTMAPSSLEKGNGARVIAAGGTIAAARRQHIASIPPSNNARGELIFGSKVSPAFREGYERYRAAFERRRREKLSERQRRGWRRWWSSIFSRDVGPGATAGSKPAHPRRLDGALVEKDLGNPSDSRASHPSSLRGNGSLRASPRTTRTRQKGGAVASAPASGSENSTPASSRAPSPESSPVLPNVALSASSREERRGRGTGTRSASLVNHEVLTDLSNGRADILEDGELLPKVQARRGRDRTPSITANSDERLLHSRSSSSRRSSDTAVVLGAAPLLDAQILQGTIVEEAAHEEGEQRMPNPEKVVNKTDSRSDVEATLREPMQGEEV